jgi:hypothetical protein
MLMSKLHYIGLINYWMQSGYLQLRREIHLPFKFGVCTNIFHSKHRKKRRDQYYLTIYGSTVLLLDLGRFFSFLILYTVGFLGWGSSPSQGCYLHTGQYKHRINAHTHPCLDWDSNPRSQRWSERRQFMP